MRVHLVYLFLLSFLFATTIIAQDDIVSNELHFEVNRVQPYILISKEEVKAAKTLNDLDARYKSDWVKEYIAVEISALNHGVIQKAKSPNDQLTAEQKKIITASDAGTEISVNVQYLPDNNLKQNDIKEMVFSFITNPNQDATFKGGEEKMMQYLYENAISKIPTGSFEGYDLSAIKFSIDEQGEIVNAHVFGQEYQNNKRENIDQLLLETIRTMPCWIPAQYTNGKKVAQEFALTVGNMKSCVVNMLHIRPLPVE